MTRRTRIVVATVAILLIAGTLALVFRDSLVRLALRPTDSSIPEGIQSADETSITVVAKDLATPWGIAFLPNGDMLVTERPGTVKRIAESDQTEHTVTGVVETSEGGLLGIALHPAFHDNQLLYLYSTYRHDGQLLNRVERYTYRDDRLTLESTIIDAIPGASTHDGGAIAFGPDGKLYITTGDAGNADAAQDTNTLSGKILRLHDDGSIPDDNPFGNAVYSYGHRNPQGIAWDDQGRLWSTEHGPSGMSSGRDELNLIETGANYGWPVITGDETREGMRSPIAQSGVNDTWAPGAVAYHDGSLFFTGLRGQTLYQAQINEGDRPSVTLTRHFSGQSGRLRAAIIHDDYLYISTSNTDGRGSPRPNDDQILRITTGLFSE